jgi:hypothetical protein
MLTSVLDLEGSSGLEHYDLFPLILDGDPLGVRCARYA